MATSWDRVRTIGGAICLIGAPLALLAGDLLVIDLIEYDDNAEQLKQIFEHPDRWLAGVALFMIGFTLLIGGVLVIVGRLREKGADGYGLIGGALGIIGVVASAGIVMFFGPVQWLMSQQQEANIPAMVELLDSAEDSNRFAAIFIVGLALFIGVLVLAVGLWRSGSVPVAAAALVGIGIVLEFVGNPREVQAAAIVGDVVLLAGLGWIGWIVLAEGDVVGGGSATSSAAGAPEAG